MKLVNKPTITESVIVLWRFACAQFANAAVAVGITVAAATPALHAQDSKSGVVLGMCYGGGCDVRQRLMVDSVRGAGGDSIRTIIARDLEFSDRFTVVPAASTPATAGGALNYPLFASLGVNGVIEASVLPSGWLHVELHDVGLKVIKQKQDFALPGTPGGRDWRMALHGIADGIEEWITGQRGIAQTRIAFVRDGRVWIVDSDGAGANPVTPRGLSPKWTPNGRAIVYNIVDADASPIMIMDVATGAQRALTNLRASVAGDYAPTVTPDGRSILFARQMPEGTDLFSMPVTGGAAHRLTSGRGRASGSPSVSPDGQRMVFASDRNGHQEVYIADIDGTNVELLTQGGVGERNWRDSPDWSPDGRTVAYQSGIERGAFQIMTIDVRSQVTKQITSEGRNDDPSWAPDSRHLVITSTRSNSSQIWVVDAVSGKARQLTRGAGARMSAWSPRLTGTP
ncbi:MAG: hypothetical protein M3Y64_05675 [Gemmatimonadota bacterium]|nr:hypothetical protein [Gemmatimonadota bacterium]